ncbi:putative MATE family efflux protein [Oceanotoga teriensis]|uniref:Multidrug export protein MepA n=1 Tax=Oceanotoga teriensis TaxID=515440 RepID=A0AA45C563_9BACT|nr:MATE family efflux transporter [Oceanotoga teriensis]PWJ87900.1 putative MATE family efflux protein [Oceanotoga teriensis]
MNNKKIELIKNGNILKGLFILGIPMIISMMVSALYNVIDTYFVSGLGTINVASVSIAFPISLIFSGIGLTFGTGGGSYISRLIGQKKYKKANEVSSISFFSCIFTSFLFIIIFFIFLDKILVLIGANQEILPIAKNYTKIFLISMIFTSLNITLGNIAVSQGGASISLIAMLSGSILNIILDPLLIYNLDLKVIGAGIATLISQIITSIIYSIFFISKKSIIKIQIKNFKFDIKIYSEIIKIGISMFLLQLLTSISMSLISKKSSIYGSQAIAAMGIVLRINTLGMNIIFGFMKGMQPMAGFNYGAKNYKRLKSIIKHSIISTTIFCMIWTIFIILFSNSILSYFSNDCEVLKIGIKALKINTLLFFTLGFQFTYSTLFISIGKGFQGLILNILRQGIFFIPLILILPNIFGLNGIIFSQPIADFFATLITFFYAFKLKKTIK